MSFFCADTSEITKSSKYSSRVGRLTSCRKPFPEQKRNKVVPSTDVDEECLNQCLWCTFMSPIKTVATCSSERLRHSLSQPLIEATSPAQGGLYQTPQSTGPMSVNKVCQDLSWSTLRTRKMTCSANPSKANTAMPPPLLPSSRSLLEISL